MATETKKFRLSIWKPANPARRLLIFSRPNTGASSLHESSDFDFHEELYSWEPKEDVWLSVIDPEDQRNLKALLIDRFAPGRPANTRGIEHLSESINALQTLLSDPTKTAWADSEESREVNGETLNFRCHGIAALHNHLRWLYEVFKAVPDVSVTIR